MMKGRKKMKAGKLTNTLLALIFLALLAHLAVPLLRTNEASAAGKDSISPAAAAAKAGVPPVFERMASRVADGLGRIAQSNKQIANAIKEHARSNERIAVSLEDVAREMKELDIKVTAPSSAFPPGMTPEELEEANPNWWKGYIEE